MSLQPSVSSEGLHSGLSTSDAKVIWLCYGNGLSGATVYGSCGKGLFGKKLAKKNESLLDQQSRSIYMAAPAVQRFEHLNLKYSIIEQNISESETRTAQCWYLDASPSRSATCSLSKALAIHLDQVPQEPCLLGALQRSYELLFLLREQISC